MRTVSYKMAQKLYDKVDLDWDWKIGDRYCIRNELTDEIIATDIVDKNFSFGNPCPEYYTLIWMPTLSDLLEWLEEHGYIATIGPALIVNGRVRKYECTITSIQNFHGKFFHANTREDTVAKAVLWILKEGKKCLDCRE